MTRWPLCCSLLFAVSACAPAFVGSRHAGDVGVRARLLRIEDSRRDEPAFLDSLLTNPAPAIRAHAALTAGRLGGGAHVAPLRALAADADADAASSAFFALTLLADSGSASLAQAGLHREPRVAIEAATLLGAIGDRGRPGLVGALADTGLDHATMGAVLLAAARLRPVPAAAVAPWVSATDTMLAWRAAYALARGRSATGVRTLLGAATASPSALREQVARGLGRGMAGDSLADTALTALRVLVTDAEPRVRVNAVRSLASYAAKGGLHVLGALLDPDAGVRLASAQSLDAVLDSAPSQWMLAMLADTAFVVQRAIAEGAVRHGVRAVVPAAWGNSAEWERRAAAAELDATGPALASLPRAQRWSRDADPRVRAAAMGAVARLADSADARAAARALLREALLDDDVQVRAAALGGLSTAPTSEDLLRALISRGRFPDLRDNDARLAFWTLADSALRGAAPLPDTLERRLAALPRPSDPLERAAASRIARFAAWRDLSGVARDLEWYDARAREALTSRPPHARIETARGTLELELFTNDAPLTVYNFESLARAGYFDGQRFHRVVPNFVVQGGDPRGDGNGGPGYAIRDEINARRYGRGTLGMALSGPHTGGSQFFITHSPQPHLDGGYTVFGQLVSGGETLDRIVQGDRIVRVTIH